MGKLGFGYHYAGECNAMAWSGDHHAHLDRSVTRSEMVSLAQGTFAPKCVSWSATESSFAEVQNDNTMRLDYIVNTRKGGDHKETTYHRALKLIFVKLHLDLTLLALSLRSASKLWTNSPVDPTSGPKPHSDLDVE
jgi:hypothetical protein